MALKLMYITNNPTIAKIAESSGVDRIFVDLEIIGKAIRQGGMDTVQSHHTLSDVKLIKESLSKSELLVRCNPIHKNVDGYLDTKEEIEEIIKNGADIIMLPFFKTKEEVEFFIKCVNNRVKTMLLFETPESINCLDQILNIEGIDEVFIGLNDLSLGYHKKFMFELLSNGLVEDVCYKFKKKGLIYGFGGVAAIGQGTLPAEKIIKEHYRLGSSSVILSRSFCNVDKIKNIEEIKSIFFNGLKAIRKFEKECKKHKDYFEENRIEVVNIVNSLTGEKE